MIIQFNVKWKMYFASFDGWLYGHGITDYDQRENDRLRILAGEYEGIQLLNFYNISYIVIDDEIRNSIARKFISSS